jgi:hypothetical protein
MRHSLAGIVLSRLVGTWFQSLFTPLDGVLFTFPSRYWFAIGHQGVFSLAGWSPPIPTGLHESRGTWDTASSRSAFVYGAITRYGRSFQNVRLTERFVTLLMLSHDPSDGLGCWFRLVPVRSPLLGESRLISIPPGTEMFQFSGLASPHLCIQCGILGHDSKRVAPFGYLRIDACVRLPGAYRS